ncbi:trace amine-associated receptor 13c-like [Erpetoichthys calabaricus]|uniref:trace amine-associated receptor 13c-like n=1 Tax=Erpetoichthys calabaricus TaxID=27687 RepID=UPI002233F3C1|nr:trace amine-associated receptor 13c-like [Erpetoichthys calabaricus]
MQNNDVVLYCYYPDNVSCIKEARDATESLFLYITAAGAVMLTFFGNLVVIISISHFRQLHTPTNILILSLAVADFLVGVVVMPFMTIQSIETCWYFGEKMCIIYTLVLSGLTTASMMNLAVIAIDRYLAISNPMMYAIRVSVRLTCFWAVSVWLVTLSYVLTWLFLNGNPEGPKDFDPCPGDCVFVLNLTWGTIDLVFTFILPVSVMVILYTRIIIIAKRHVKAISKQQRVHVARKNNNTTAIKKSETKASKTLGIVVLVFLLCWLPFYICTILNQFLSYPVPSVVFRAFWWLAFLNSGINPIIYGLFYPWFRKSFKLMVTFQICSHGSSLINLISEK